MSQYRNGRLRLTGLLLLLALLAAACGGEAGATGGSGSDPTLSFRSPVDGAEVPETFTVEFDSDVALADPSTGEHHVHLCIDSGDCASESEYTLVYGNSFEVTDLTPGEHTIEASLRNADHSDAGAGDEITVTVSEDGAAPDEVTETTAGSSVEPGY